MYLTSTVRSSARLYSEPIMSWDEGGDWPSVSDQHWDVAEGDEDAWATTGEDAGAAATASWEDASCWAPAPVVVPTAFAIFPADLVVAPRELAERYFAVERFTVMPRGGHFAALEEPELLAQDLLQFLAGRH